MIFTTTITATIIRMEINIHIMTAATMSSIATTRKLLNTGKKNGGLENNSGFGNSMSKILIRMPSVNMIASLTKDGV